MTQRQSLDESFDLIVVGGGAGGLSAARAAVGRDARTLLISDGPPGGDCTFTGCVPSKTLLAAASDGLSFADAMTRVTRTVHHVASTEDFATLEGEGISTKQGRARFIAGDTVEVGRHRFRSERIVVATGSNPWLPAIDGLAEDDVLTNDNVFDLREQPSRLAVLGGGPVGCELAMAFAGFDSEVCVFESRPRLLPRDEPEASASAERTLEKAGVAVLTGEEVVEVRPVPGGSARTVITSAGRELEVDAVLVATGRDAATSGLEAHRAGLELDEDGSLRVDSTCATTTNGVWAVGDVTGGMQFTHVAARMAMVAVENAFSNRFAPAKRFDPSGTPWVTYLQPEVAHVGMTEAEAAGHAGRVAWLPLEEVDRAITSGLTDGFVKLIAGPRRVLGNIGGGKLLGATIVAPRAGEMIHEVVLAMRTRMFTGRLAQTVHAYPSWSLAVQEAAAQFFTEHRGRSARPASAAQVR